MPRDSQTGLEVLETAAPEEAVNETASGGQSGAIVKATGKGLSPVGNIAMDPTQTAELLANMQQMVDDRSGAGSQFMRGLERASAWGSGGAEGPARALTAVNAQQQAEDTSLFNMRQQMAALKSAAAQQQAYNEEQARIFGPGGTGMAGGTGGAGASGQAMYKGVPIDDEIKVAMAQARTREERDKIFNDFASKRSQAKGSFAYGAPTYQTTIKFVDPKTGRLEYIDAATAKKYKDMGYGDYVVNPPTAVAPGRVPPEAIKQVESGGRPGLVSSAGAEGTMQVMPNTQKNPGYGVTPARDNSQQELERVGRDYYAAMQKQYGNDTLASIAYNMGPGATDSWLKKGGNFRDLPQETRDYIGQVHLATAKLNRAPAETATMQPTAAAVAPRQRMTIPEAEIAMEAQKQQGISAATAEGKYIGNQAATVREAGNTSGERLSSIEYLDGLINNPETSRVFGVFQKPGFMNGIGNVIQKGVNLGRLGDVGIKELDSLVVANMKNATQTEIDAAQKATREFAKIKLNEAKILLAGQGAVSDAERGLIQELSGSRMNSPGALRDYLAWGRMRAEYDRDVGKAYQTYRRQNPNAGFQNFLDTGVADDLRDAYNQKLMDFGSKTGINMDKAAAAGGQQPEQPKAAPQWKYSDDDYAAWKKSRGLK